MTTQRKRASIYRRVPDPVYGYRWVTVDGRKVGLAPDPVTADVVRRIYRDAAGGQQHQEG